MLPDFLKQGRPISDGMNHEHRSRWREQLSRAWHVPFFDRLNDSIHRLSKGDRFIVYTLTAIAGIASVASLYALQQSILVKEPAYGGTLIEGALGNPQFINPLLAISDADRDLSALTYAGLMGLTSDGSLTPILAESYTISADGKVYTFVLREKAKFSDGASVTAGDVVFTIKKAQNPALKSPEYANWSGVNVVAVDERTVRFTLSRPYAPFLGLTTIGILPARLWQNISDAEFPFSSLQTAPVGTGPFKVTSITRDASGLIKSVALADNPNYALGRPYLDGITFEFYANADDLARAVKSGAVESAYGVPSSGALTAPYARVFGVFFNPSTKQVFARLEVRKALSLALDRDSIVKNVLGGYATPLMGPVPPGKSVRPFPVPQPDDYTAAAAHVLEAADWSYDSTERVWKNPKVKQPLDVITIRTSNVPELKNIATAVKEDWEALGIRVDIELYEPGDLSQNVIRPRKYDTLLYGMVIGHDQDLYAFWDSKERNDPGLNIALYANKAVDTLLEEARSTVSEETRKRNLQKIEDTVAAEYPAAFIYAPSFVYTVPSDLQGVDLPQIITPSDRFAMAATWYRYTDAVWPFLARQK